MRPETHFQKRDPIRDTDAGEAPNGGGRSGPTNAVGR